MSLSKNAKAMLSNMRSIVFEISLLSAKELARDFGDYYGSFLEFMNSGLKGLGNDEESRKYQERVEALHNVMKMLRRMGSGAATHMYTLLQSHLAGVRHDSSEAAVDELTRLLEAVSKRISPQPTMPVASAPPRPLDPMPVAQSVSEIAKANLAEMRSAVLQICLLPAERLARNFDDGEESFMDFMNLGLEGLVGDDEKAREYRQRVEALHNVIKMVGTERTRTGGVFTSNVYDLLPMYVAATIPKMSSEAAVDELNRLLDAVNKRIKRPTVASAPPRPLDPRPVASAPPRPRQAASSGWVSSSTGARGASAGWASSSAGAGGASTGGSRMSSAPTLQDVNEAFEWAYDFVWNEVNNLMTISNIQTENDPMLRAFKGSEREGGQAQRIREKLLDLNRQFVSRLVKVVDDYTMSMPSTTGSPEEDAALDQELNDVHTRVKAIQDIFIGSAGYALNVYDTNNPIVKVLQNYYDDVNKDLKRRIGGDYNPRLLVDPIPPGTHLAVRRLILQLKEIKRIQNCHAAASVRSYEVAQFGRHVNRMRVLLYSNNQNFF